MYFLWLHPNTLSHSAALHRCSEKRPVREGQIVPFSGGEAVE